jgi:hypothetical protein
MIEVVKYFITALRLKIRRFKIWEISRIEVKFLFCIKALFAEISAINTSKQAGLPE